MRFWDSSAVLPLVLEQEASATARRLLADDGDMAVWWATLVECHSAVARLERERLLTAEKGETARRELASLSAAWNEVQPSDPLRRSALRLLRLHSLRAADALQGAAALTVSEHDAQAVRVVCLDRRLIDALRREGMAIDVPGTPA